MRIPFPCNILDPTLQVVKMFWTQWKHAWKDGGLDAARRGGDPSCVSRKIALWISQGEGKVLLLLPWDALITAYLFFCLVQVDLAPAVLQS